MPADLCHLSDQGEPIRISKKEDAMIKKVKGGYKVLSEKGKNLGGPYKSKEEAQKRLRQVEYFKHNKG
jgi:phosphosulfolactate synthase (CoM biosynthesis protein A)